MHFPEDAPGGGATERAVAATIAAWRPRRGADWADLMVQAQTARAGRLLLGAGTAAAILLGAAALAVGALAHGLPTFDAVRARLLP